MTAEIQAESDHDEAQEGQAPAAAEGLAATMLALVALILIVAAPFATRPQPPGRGWFLAPIAWPLVSLGLTLAAGSVLAFRFARDWRDAPDAAAFRSQARSAFAGLPLALEHAAWFCLYLAGVSYLGFALATFIYLQFMAWRSGLRGWPWAGVALLITVALVLIFRVGIGIWFPLPPILRFLPDWVANTFGGVL